MKLSQFKQLSQKDEYDKAKARMTEASLYADSKAKCGSIAWSDAYNYYYHLKGWK